jgi:CHAT domain-containing protein
MVKEVVIQLIIILLLTATLRAQCPPKDSIKKNISSIFYDSKLRLQERLDKLFEYGRILKKCSSANDSNYSYLLRTIGYTYSDKSDFVRAGSYFRQSIDIITANAKSPSIALRDLIGSYYHLSVFYDSLNNVFEKMKAVNNCINIALQLNLASDISCLRSLYMRVKYSFDMGDYKRCIDDAEMCEQLARNYIKTVQKGSRDYAAGEGIILSSLGWYVNVQLLVKNFASAEEFLTNKLIEYKKGGLEKYLGLIYSQIAETRLQKGDYKNALISLETGLQFARRAQNNFMCKQLENTIAYKIYYSHLQEGDKALYYYRKALAHINNDQSQEKDDAMESLNIFANIANVYVQKGAFDTAFRYFQLAFDKIMPGKNEKDISQISPEEIRKFKKIYYLESLLIDKADAFQKKYRIIRQPDDARQAIAVYREADQFLDRIRKVQFDAESKLFWRSDSRRLYEHAIETCHLIGNASEAFYFFEKSRAVLLTDQLTEQHWLGLEDISKQSQIKKELLQLERELDNIMPASTRSAEIRAELFARRLELDNLDLMIRIHNPLFSQTTGGASVTLSDVKKNLLKDHQALLEIFSGDSAVYIVVIATHDTYFTRINKVDFEKASALYISYFQDGDRINRDFAGFRTASYNLYKLIFQNNTVPKGRIIISPGGTSYFPFESLITDNSPEDPVYFIADYAVSYTYSASYLLNNFATGTTVSSGNFLGIAPVHFPTDLQLPALSGSDLSLGKIGSYIRDAHNLVEKNASKNSFLQKFPGHKIIQLYTHSSDSSDRKEPVIYFADSSLYLSDLIPENIPLTRLIVLSACETGRGKLYQGEGVFSFNRGFAALGIPSCIANLWSVDNVATYQLTESFYKYLSKGVPLDVALQKAKLEFLNNALGENKLPYYWAPAVLIGKTDSIELNKKSNQWKSFLFIAVLSGVILFGLSQYIRKKK